MIVPMKHISLFARKSDERRIMKALQENGVVQIERFDGDSANDSVNEAAGLFRSSAQTELAQKESTVAGIKAALSRLNAYLPKAGFLDAPPEADEAELTASVPEALEVVSELDALQKKQAVLKSEADKKNSAVKALRPFAGVDMPLGEIKPTRTCTFCLGLIRPEKLPALDEAGIMYDLFPAEGSKAPILAAIPNAEREQTLSVLHAAGFAEAALPDIPGVPAESIAIMESELASNALEQKELSEKIEALGEKGALLKKGLDGAMIEKGRAEARCELFSTRETFGLTGWVRADEAEKLQEIVSEAAPIHYLETRDPEEDEQPPTYCRNSKFFAPFEFITNMYSPPDPRGFDPTVVMAPFYLLFFGLMMGDTGYGLVITLGALLFLKLKKPKSGTGTEQVCRILVWGGVSTMICGLLTGTVFGMSWKELFGEGFPFPLLDPMKDQMTAMILYCGLGFAQIIAGMIVSIAIHLKRGDWQTALFDVGSWLMIFAGAAIALLIKSPVKYAGYALIGLGLLLIIVFGGRNKKGFGRVIGGLGKLYDITGFFSDVLSYARVFALGLATGVMGGVFNMISSMVSGALKGIPVVGPVISLIVTAVLLVLLHMFCIAINALGSFIHCARLQFIEYYNRFYSPGGHLFKPLAEDTKYNKVIK